MADWDDVRRIALALPATDEVTSPRFDGYPAVLVQLERIAADELEELTVEAWLARAPKRLADQYLDASR